MVTMGRPSPNEQNVVRTNVNLLYGPPVNTNTDYNHPFLLLFWLFFRIFQILLTRQAMLAILNFGRRREASVCLILLRAKQGSHWYHFYAYK